MVKGRRRNAINGNIGTGAPVRPAGLAAFRPAPIPVISVVGYEIPGGESEGVFTIEKLYADLLPSWRACTKQGNSAAPNNTGIDGIREMMSAMDMAIKAALPGGTLEYKSNGYGVNIELVREKFRPIMYAQCPSLDGWLPFPVKPVLDRIKKGTVRKAFLMGMAMLVRDAGVGTWWGDNGFYWEETWLEERIDNWVEHFDEEDIDNGLADGEVGEWKACLESYRNGLAKKTEKEIRASGLSRPERLGKLLAMPGPFTDAEKTIREWLQELAVFLRTGGSLDSCDYQPDSDEDYGDALDVELQATVIWDYIDEDPLGKLRAERLDIDSQNYGEKPLFVWCDLSNGLPDMGVFEQKRLFTNRLGETCISYHKMLSMLEKQGLLINTITT